MPNNEHVVNFWHWFATNSRQIHDAYRRDDHEWLDVNISPRIELIGEQLNWELGPYNEPDNTFVLSPTIRENLTLTRAAIMIAPKLDGWHFAFAKPLKKLLSLEFSAQNCTINADDWRYQLTAYNNGEFADIDLFINSSNSPPTVHLNIFCELVIEALLGEECRLDRIGYLTPNVVDDNTTIENSTAIQHLNDHLSQLLTPTQNDV